MLFVEIMIQSRAFIQIFEHLSILFEKAIKKSRSVKVYSEHEALHILMLCVAKLQFEVGGTLLVFATTQVSQSLSSSCHYHVFLQPTDAAKAVQQVLQLFLGHYDAVCQIIRVNGSVLGIFLPSDEDTCLQTAYFTKKNA